MASGIASPKYFGEDKNVGSLKCLTLARNSIFVWDAASQSKKSLDMLKIWGNYGPLAPPMCMAVVIEKKTRKDY